MATATTSIPGRSSDAGPESQAMDLSDWAFELAYEADQYEKAVRDERTTAASKHFEAVETAFARIQEMRRRG